MTATVLRFAADSPLEETGLMSTAVKTVKRDYARVSSCPDAATVLRQLDCWFEHYNTVHPHKALGYRSPREFRKWTVEADLKRSAGPARWPPIARYAGSTRLQRLMSMPLQEILKPFRRSSRASGISPE